VGRGGGRNGHPRGSRGRLIRSAKSPVYPPIGDYAVIGDCRSAALIARDGSLDWLCLPRFDSPAVFAALLDRRDGGSFSVRPIGAFASSRRYVGDTNVLETTFRTGTGTLRLLDLMPVATEAEKRRELWPNHQVLRRLECLDGAVEVEILCDPRPDYGRIVPRAEDLLGRGSPRAAGRCRFPQAFTHVGLISAALTLRQLEHGS
jgi:GH15 family glucan-1,4-alpha-glucosidase